MAALIYPTREHEFEPWTKMAQTQCASSACNDLVWGVRNHGESCAKCGSVHTKVYIKIITHVLETGTYLNPVLSMKCHFNCRDEVKHIDCLQMSAERLHREWTKEHPDIKVKGSGSIKKKHTPPEQKPLNVCFNLTLYSEHNTNIFLRITSQF